MAGIDDVNDIVAAFLVAASDALALTDAGPPGRIYTSAGRPALDCCGQLTAWAQTLADAPSASDPGGLASSMRPRKLGAVPVLGIYIQATRCAPTPTNMGGRIALPDPADLAATSRMTSQDIWALWNHLNSELKDGTLAEICKGAWRDGAIAIEGQGGCVGWEIVYRYPLEGGLLAT